MGNAITVDARALWVFIRNSGGWWSVSMLTHHWRPTFADHEVEAHMGALVRGRFLVERMQLGTVQFCVTSDCLHLPGTEGTS